MKSRKQNKKPSKGRRPHRAFRLLLWLVAFPLVLVLVAVALPYFIPTGVLKGRVESIMAEQLQRDVAVRDIDIQWWTRFRINGLKVARRKGEPRPPLELARASVRLKLWPLLRGVFEIEQLVFIRPKVFLVFDTSGRLNIQEIFEQKTKKPQDAKSGRRAIVHVLRLVEADLEVVDEQVGRQYRLPAINIDVRRASRALLSYDVSAHINQTLVRPADVTLKLRGRVDLSRTKSKEGPERWSMRLTRAELSARLDDGKGGIELAANALNARMTATQKQGAPPYDELWVQCGLQGKSVDLWAKSEPAKGGTWRHRFRLKCPELDLSAVLDTANRLSAALPGSSGPTEIPEALKKLRVNGDVRVQRLLYGPTVVDRAGLHLALSAGRLAISKVSGTFSGGDLVAAAEVDLNEPRPVWSLAGSLEGVRGNAGLQVVADALAPQSIRCRKGKGEIAFNFVARGLTRRDLIRTLSGKLSGQFGPMTIVRDRPPAAVAELFPALDTREVHLREVAWRSSVENGTGDLKARMLGVPPIPVGYALGSSNLTERKWVFEFGVDPWSTMGLRRRKDSRFKGSQGFPVLTLRGLPWERKWHANAPKRFAVFMKELLLDNPLVLVDPSMSPSDKGRYIAKQFRGFAGTVIHPLAIVGEGGVRALSAIVGAPKAMFEAFVSAVTPKEEAAKKTGKEK